MCVDNKDFAKALEQRTRAFGVSILQVSVNLPNTLEARVVRNQLTKSGTSIGANYREANRSRSRADFKSKIKICESEASETQYWLEILVDAGLVDFQFIEACHKECGELLALFTSIGKQVSIQPSELQQRM
jgi:four helix bundle protein